jgi:hypothetical protein
MGRLTISVGVLLLSVTSGCTDLGEPSSDDIINSTGTIILEHAQFFLIRSDVALEGHLQTFYPLNLPEDFRRGGLRVRFSGSIEVDSTVQYAFPPIRLSRIELIGE